MTKAIGAAGRRETDTSRNYEVTDWQEVERFAARFTAQLEVAAAA